MTVLILLTLLVIWSFKRGGRPYREEVPEYDMQQSDSITKNSYDIISEPFLRNDTLFLKEITGRDDDMNYSQAIFIEPDRKSKSYDEISDFNFDKYDWETYEASIHYLKGKDIRLEKKEIPGLPLKWIRLHQFEDKFYVYKPCDFISHYCIAITDTAFIDHTGEGPQASKIEGYKKIDNNTFLLNLRGTTQKLELAIHIIDPKNNIAVFERKSEGMKESAYYLMISADKIRNMPLIVNRCEGFKQSEFLFNEPDFNKLLAGK